MNLKKPKLVPKPDMDKVKLLKECSNCYAFLGCFNFPNGNCLVKKEMILKK